MHLPDPGRLHKEVQSTYPYILIIFLLVNYDWTTPIL